MIRKLEIRWTKFIFDFVIIDLYENISRNVHDVKQ